MKIKPVDLTNIKFDKLKVLGLDKEKSEATNKKYWRCECDCGNQISVLGSELTRQDKKAKRSCGHCTDLKPNDEFGSYTVIGKDVEKSKLKGSPFYKVRCICGNVRSVAKWDLINRKATNCGCKASENKRDTTDYTNHKFEGTKWTALYYDEEESKKRQKTMWWCRCDCGTERSVSISSIKNGSSTSCGCQSAETYKATHISMEQKFPDYHIMKKTRDSMIYRCNGGDKKVKTYFERGISVCDEWLDPEHGFKNFYNDMHPTYKPGLTLDRKNVNGKYCKENCRWITIVEQQFNKTTTSYINCYGHMMSLPEACRKLYNPAGIDANRLAARLNSGFGLDEALQIPVDSERNSRHFFYKEHPDFKVIKKPFMFMDEIENKHFIAEMIDYSLGQEYVDMTMSKYKLKNNSRVIYGVDRINYREDKK